MIFVDTNVFMFAVGRPHPLQGPAREFFRDAGRRHDMRLCTSAEVLQELLHAYLPVGRTETLDAALRLATSLTEEIWAVDSRDVLLARDLAARHPGLEPRDLLHLACCRRRDVRHAKTYDRALSAALG